ncbi:MAG: MoaF N-terminal domain-containing protein [Actinobacteria bacterium]|nr:MoaF N-terminal domain-containing protein [Actinomycetota bacterium]
MSGESTFRGAGEVALLEQFDNHDGFRPRPSSVLDGRSLTLHLAEPAVELELELGAGGNARWRLGEERGECPFEAFELRQGIVAVAARVDERRSVFAVCARERGLAVLTELELGGDGGGGAGESSRYVQFGIDAPLAERFEPTAELVGKRVQWRYSSTHSFEHIYLNPTAYCWHCIEGPERWIGDVDPCVYYRLDQDLYLFAWSETVVPFNGAVAIDLRSGTSTGRFFGWDTEHAEIGQIVVGAYGTVLNETVHVPA